MGTMARDADLGQNRVPKCRLQRCIPRARAGHNGNHPDPKEQRHVRNAIDENEGVLSQMPIVLWIGKWQNVHTGRPAEPRFKQLRFF